MPAEKDIVARLDVLTDKLSTQVRTLALGVLASSWGFLIGDTVKSLPSWLKGRLVTIGILAVTVLLLDLLQYIFGFLVAQRAHRAIEKAKSSGQQDPSVDYDSNDWAFRMSLVLFWGKVALLAMTAAWLVKIGLFYMGQHI